MDSKKPHALCIPFPAQSHIKATLMLAKLLHNRGFHITFVNTEFNHRRFLQSRGPHALAGLPDFRFATIPDGIPPSSIDATQDVRAICSSIRNFMLAPFRDLLADLMSRTDGDPPPVSCVINDTMPFAVDAARELGVPSVSYWSFAACAFMGFKQLRPFFEKGVTPFKDVSNLTNGYLDTEVEVPGMKNMRLRDLPSILQTTDAEDPILHWLMESADSAGGASAVLIHTFDALEPDVLAALDSIYPDRVYPVGPIQLLLDQISPDPTIDDAISYSLWKEDSECLRWLDARPRNSVIYVNFGSIITMSKRDLVEFAMGFVSSGVSFLWVIRQDLVEGELAALPPEVREKAERNGFISGWCPQEEVLNHPAVGGFLTHCGWGSVIESLTAGVPVLCLPFFGDQIVHCRFLCREWGVGMEIEKEVKRAAVEKLVRDLMNGEEGEKMRKKAEDWGRLAREATGPGGSSTVNLGRLVNEVLLPK
ncbi:unnamed protein product [Linum tenue]|uniref:Glycosyltransferase n=1 Tax=Linum tenue TaxID=586396 RepID=A0AAV0IFG9_9ROSI|nr:unnamed protein product [Linum tenue]